jgi:hypothetical protein
MTINANINGFVMKIKIIGNLIYYIENDKLKIIDIKNKEKYETEVPYAFVHNFTIHNGVVYIAYFEYLLVIQTNGTSYKFISNEYIRLGKIHDGLMYISDKNKIYAINGMNGTFTSQVNPSWSIGYIKTKFGMVYIYETMIKFSSGKELKASDYGIKNFTNRISINEKGDKLICATNSIILIIDLTVQPETVIKIVEPPSNYDPEVGFLTPSTLDIEPDFKPVVDDSKNYKLNSIKISMTLK